MVWRYDGFITFSFNKEQCQFVLLLSVLTMYVIDQTCNRVRYVS